MIKRVLKKIIPVVILLMLTLVLLGAAEDGNNVGTQEIPQVQVAEDEDSSELPEGVEVEDDSEANDGEEEVLSEEGELPSEEEKLPSDDEELPSAQEGLLSGEEVNEGKNAEAEQAESEVSVSENEAYGRVLDVPYINQRRYFPNGCEAVSAVMALNYIGVETDPNTFIKEYLDMGKAPYMSNGRMYACDPREKFPGDPRSTGGWGCYPKVIKKAVDKMQLAGIRTVILKDTPLSTLCSEYIDNGIPVVFWGTIDMIRPTTGVSWEIDDGSGRTHTWVTPFHCLLLTGYDAEYYYFNDPWHSKNTQYSKRSVEEAYDGMGREALVILDVTGNGKKLTN